MTTGMVQANRRGRAVHVVVTCANRKRYPVADQLRLGDVTARTVETRCAEWIERLRGVAPAAAASQMYAGEHWQIAQTLVGIAGPQASLWVCSAGYGLISGD